MSSVTSKQSHWLQIASLPGYPIGHETVGVNRVPVLKPASDLLVPKFLNAFNDLSRIQEPQATAIHFFKHDYSFESVVRDSLSIVEKYSNYLAVLTPDITISDGMPAWQRARNTVYSRMAGVVWQSRGLNVIPTLRWRDHKDYEDVFSGIAKNSVVAVSSYGSSRNPVLYQDFISGFIELVNILEPSTILIYGKLPKFPCEFSLGNTKVISYTPNANIPVINKAEKHNDPNRYLFDISDFQREVHPL